MKDGEVKNGVFWLSGSFWIIEHPNLPLHDGLSLQLKDFREYIERLKERAEQLEKWLDTNKSSVRMEE